MNTLKLTKMKTIKLLAFLFISSLAFTGCSDDDDDHGGDDHDHEEEVITTLTYTLTDGTDTITLTFEDLDPDDSVDGVATVSGNLKANTDYTGELTVLNKTDSDDPAHIQEEIEGEAEDHELFYTTTVANVTISKTDEDGNGNPLGFTTNLKTGAAGTGTITVVLKHEPKKPNDGSVADAGGNTDIEATFTVEVE